MNNLGLREHTTMEGIVLHQFFKNTDYITLGFKASTDYLTFFKLLNNLFIASGCPKLIKTLRDNDIEFTTSVTNDKRIYSDKEIDEMITEGRKLYFDIYKTDEEMIDFLCGNTWPKHMGEFVERVVLSLTDKGN